MDLETINVSSCRLEGIAVSLFQKDCRNVITDVVVKRELNLFLTCFFAFTISIAFFITGAKLVGPDSFTVLATLLYSSNTS